jgi:hypothetical protein
MHYNFDTVYQNNRKMREYVFGRLYDVA